MNQISCAEIKGLSNNYYGNSYLWVDVSNDRQYFISYGSTFIEVYKIPYGNNCLARHIATFRIHK